MIDSGNKSSLVIKEDVVDIIGFFVLGVLGVLLLLIGWLTPVVELLAFYDLYWIRLLVWGVLILCGIGCLLMVIDWRITEILLPDLKWRGIIVFYLLVMAVPLVRFWLSAPRGRG